MEAYKEKFIERTKNHIQLVNKYAQKIGHTYNYHDADKLQGELFEPYALSFKYDGFGNGAERKKMTQEELNAYNEATLKHISRNPHHPEYWINPKLKTFDRDNPPRALDCRKMSDAAITEMCCDWCAMSEEFGNTPFEWAAETIGERWVFDDRQVKFIYNLLEDLWN